jgi:hypothetical protein
VKQIETSQSPAYVCDIQLPEVACRSGMKSEIETLGKNQYNCAGPLSVGRVVVCSDIAPFKFRGAYVCMPENMCVESRHLCASATNRGGRLCGAR